MKTKSVYKGITQAQNDLIAYWCSLRGSDGNVQRADMDPGKFRSMLANISIVEFDRSGTGRFRLTGSRLRDIIGMEGRGRRVEELVGTLGETYALGLSYALERGVPVGGSIEVDDNKVHAWLRLPLAGADGQLTQVLCLDQLLPAKGVSAGTSGEDRTFPQVSGWAAA